MSQSAPRHLNLKTKYSIVTTLNLQNEYDECMTNVKVLEIWKNNNYLGFDSTTITVFIELQ